MVRRAEHFNALLVHVLDAKLPANEPHRNFDGFSVGHVLSLAARPLRIAAHTDFADRFGVRFRPIELVGISVAVHLVEPLAADLFQASVPNRVDAIGHIWPNALFLGYAANEQLNALLIPLLGKSAGHNADDLSSVGQIDLGQFTLAPIHACGVEAISLRQVLVHLCREHLVDV